MLWIVALELRLLGHAASAEAVAGVPRGLLHQIKLCGVVGVDSWPGGLHHHAACLLVLYLGDQVAVVLHVLHHEVVVGEVGLVLGLGRGRAAGQSADGMVLGAAGGGELVVSGIGLHVA